MLQNMFKQQSRYLTKIYLPSFNVKVYLKSAGMKRNERGKELCVQWIQGVSSSKFIEVKVKRIKMLFSPLLRLRSALHLLLGNGARSLNEVYC
jgi:hypothetical protein